jgi:hypothetical protein
MIKNVHWFPCEVSLILSDVDETWIFLTDLRYTVYSNLKFNESPSSVSQVVPRGQADWRTDMAKLTVALRNFANAPETNYIKHLK